MKDETRIYHGVISFEEIDHEKLRKHLTMREKDRVIECIAEDGSRRKLPLRLDLANHSPTGFHWGYGGSGPAQTALAILADWSANDAWALRWHQDFKWEVIARLPQDEDFSIASTTITTWATRDANRHQVFAPGAEPFKRMAYAAREVARDARAAAAEFMETDDIGRLLGQLADNLESCLQQFEDEDHQAGQLKVPDLPEGVTAYIGNPETGEFEGPVSGADVARALGMVTKEGQ